MLEDIYLRAADELVSMAAAGDFPVRDRVEDALESPRVGDGLLRLDATGCVEYASPNAVSAFRRLGLATNLAGADLAELVARLGHRPVGSGVTMVVGGQAPGRVEVDAPGGTVVIRSIPLAEGSLVLIRDVSEVRRGQRTVLSREATIREIHHRVKNNLHTVGALLRLQSRRSESTETRAALAEAQARIGAIAVVHDALSTDADSEADLTVVLEALVQLMRELAPAFGTVPEFHLECASIRLPGERLTPLAMCITEVLTNAVEHAQAGHIDVRVTRSGRGLDVRITDDGVGFDAPIADGLGMSIVAQLVESELGGEVSIDSAHGRGTTVEISARMGPG
jgi:two-component sensor histidine kinase